MTSNKNILHKAYGVYDNSMLSLSGVYSADITFPTLLECFKYIGEQFNSCMEGDNFRFSIHPSYYEARTDSWKPLTESSNIEIDGRYFIPLEDIDEESS